MKDRFVDRRAPDVHLHECKDREDEVCGSRGYCICECGELRRFPDIMDLTRAGWRTSAEVFA